MSLHSQHLEAIVALFLIVGQDGLVLLTGAGEEESEGGYAENVSEFASDHGSELDPVGAAEHIGVTLLHLQVVLDFDLVHLLLLQGLYDIL